MAPRVNAFIENAAANGVTLHFNSAYRTPEHQAALHSDPRAITPADNSLHSAGFAVDVNYSSLPPSQQEFIRNAARDAGLHWGGDFRASDPPHFYIDPPVDRAIAIANATKQFGDKVGNPTAVAAPQAERASTPSPTSEQAQGAADTPPTTQPQALLRLDQPAHPDHLLFCQAQAQVRGLDARFGRAPDGLSDNLAAALAVQAKAGQLRGIHALVLSDDGNRAYVVDTADLNNVFKRHANVEIASAINQSIEQSTQQIAQVDAALGQNMQAPQQSEQMAQLPEVQHHGPRMM